MHVKVVCGRAKLDIARNLVERAGAEHYKNDSVLVCGVSSRATKYMCRSSVDVPSWIMHGICWGRLPPDTIKISVV